MKRGWTLPVAALALCGGSMLAATGQASASSTGTRAGHIAMRPASLIANPGGGSPAHLRFPPLVSTNWSGYLASGAANAFSSVSAKWVEPTPTCATSTNQYAAAWAGLDGYLNNTVEQIGSIVTCTGSTASYAGFYELYPAAAATLPAADVISGNDSMKASVTCSSGTFTLKIRDMTVPWTYTHTATSSTAQCSSAEVIVEDPYLNSNQAQFTKFGTITFTAASVNGSPLAAATPVKAILGTAPGGTPHKDSISAITGGGHIFHATWLHY